MTLRSLRFLCRAFFVCGLGLILASCGSTKKKTADNGARIDKVKYFHMKEWNKVIPAADPSITFEREFHLYGAISNKDRVARQGDYYDVMWQVTDRSQPVVVRLEYRQAKTGLLVKTKETTVQSPKKGNVTSFEVIGDEYVKDGPVGSWRAILLRGKEVLSEEKSYLWE